MMARGLTHLVFIAVLGLNTMFSAGRADEFGVAMEQALQRSETIAAARQNLRAAIEELPVARSTLNATTELKLTGSRAETSTKDEDFVDSDTGTASLTLKKPLYDGGIAGAQESINELAVDQARTELRLEEQNVLLAAINAYVGLVVARDRVELEQANKRRLDEYLRATTLRVELGDATPTDLAATQAQQARAQASLISAETSLVNAEETYRAIIDEPNPAIALPALPPDTPESAVVAGDRALEGNHAHRLAHFAERSARRSLDLLAANVRPKIDFDLTGRSVDSDNENRVTDEVAANITLSTPLTPNSAVRARARSTVASHRAAVFRLRDSERNTRLGAENAHRDFQAASLVIDAYSAELEAAILLRNGTQSEVDFGLKTVLDLLDVERDVVNAQVNLLEANRNRIVAAYTLMASVGGLSAAGLGLDVDVSGPDDQAIDQPIVLRPLPVIRYQE